VELEDTLHDPLGGASQSQHDMDAAIDDEVEFHAQNEALALQQDHNSDDEFLADLAEALPASEADAAVPPGDVECWEQPHVDQSHASQVEQEVAGDDAPVTTLGTSAESLVRCRKRRLLPGATTSAQDFEALLDTLECEAHENLSAVSGSKAESSAQILTKTRALISSVSTRYRAS